MFKVQFKVTDSENWHYFDTEYATHEDAQDAIKLDIQHDKDAGLFGGYVYQIVEM